MRYLSLPMAAGALAALTAVAACGAFSSDVGDGAGDAAAPEASSDASNDASSDDAAEAGPRCREEDPFGRPTELDGVNEPGVKSGHPTLRADEKEIFFQHADAQIFVARRGDRTLPFDAPKAIDTGDAGLSAQDPAISGDGLVLYIGVTNQLARMVRPSLTAPFGAPALIGLDDPAEIEGDPFILPANTTLYFTRDENGGKRASVWRAVRSANNTFPIANRVDLGDASAQHPAAAADDLTLYFANTLDSAIYRATRTSAAAPFDPPKRVAELSISSTDGGIDRPGWMSPDRCRMYMAASPTGIQRIYVAERAPR